MDMAVVRKWVLFFAGILVSILIADALSTLVVAALGISGWIKLVLGFVLYALLFFALLYLIERIFHVSFFGFNRE
jgi:hypothetical protein